MPKKKVRHILGISGGKDSAALAIYLHDKIPEMEYFFCDTHKELPETYEFLERLKTRLGIQIKYLEADRGFDYWLEILGGYLPTPKARWCTKNLKIIPMEKFIGDDEAISYVGIRADEKRDGYISRRPNIKAVFPFKEDGLVKSDIIQILEDSGIGMPGYYSWRSRSGCYFCFFQRKYEWLMLSEKHPDYFAKAVEYEEDHKDGRTFTWNEGERLLDLIKRKDDIIRRHEEYMEREKQNAPEKPLTEVFADVSDSEGTEKPCFICQL